MEKGAYIVRSNPEVKFDIIFSIKPDIDDVSEIQQKLHLEVERTLVVIRKLYESNEVELNHYFNQLLTLAQAGLVPDNAQPAISLNALQQLKNEVVDKKSGEVKNAYFKLLGRQAILCGVGPLTLALLIKLIRYYAPRIPELNDLSIFANYLYIWCGCMLGIWLSFGARKTVLTFEELTTIEEDRLEPTIRLIFTGAIAMLFGLLFYTNAITLSFGSITTTQISSDAFVAIIFGVILGLSEQVLGKKITKKATEVFDKF